METNNHVCQAMFIEFPAELLDPAEPLNAEAQAAQVARSEENIFRWMQYLPEDCVATMIAMGWDITT